MNHNNINKIVLIGILAILLLLSVLCNTDLCKDKATTYLEKNIDNNTEVVLLANECETSDAITIDSIYLRQVMKMPGDTIDQGESGAIAIIDSGIYPRGEFDGKIVHFQDFVNGKLCPYDDSGHGTAVAGIVTSLTNQKIVALKVLDYRNEGKITDIIAALKWVKDNYQVYNIRIVNISIGIDADKGNEDFCDLCQDISDLGIVIVSSVGNNEKFGQCIPANFSEVIAVGSIGIDGNGKIRVSSFSKKGKGDSDDKVDIYAFGEKIEVLESNTLYKGNKEEKINSIDTRTIENGTSFSCAVVSGLAGKYLDESPAMCGFELRKKLVEGEEIYDLGIEKNIPILVYKHYEEKD